MRFDYRNYDPDIGIWLLPDLIGFVSGDLNLYRYVNNDPVNLVDPSGLFVIFFGGQGSAGAGLGVGVSSGKWIIRINNEEGIKGITIF